VLQDSQNLGAVLQQTLNNTAIQYNISGDRQTYIQNLVSLSTVAAQAAG
jgi:hypothetical protein